MGEGVVRWSKECGEWCPPSTPQISLDSLQQRHTPAGGLGKLPTRDYPFSARGKTNSTTAGGQTWPRGCSFDVTPRTGQSGKIHSHCSSSNQQLHVHKNSPPFFNRHPSQPFSSLTLLTTSPNLLLFTSNQITSPNQTRLLENQST